MGLFIMLLKGIVTTPYNWLVAQLDGFAGFLQDLEIEIAKEDIDHAVLDIILDGVSTYLKAPLGYILDEAHLLADVKIQWTAPFGRKWTQLQWLLQNIISYRNLSITFLGTAFSIARTSSLRAPVASFGGMKMILITKFPYLDEDAVLETVSSSLDLTDVSGEVLDKIKYLLTGRAAFASFFVRYFATYRDIKWKIADFKQSKSDELNHALDLYTSDVIDSIRREFKSIKAVEGEPESVDSQLFRLWRTHVTSFAKINSVTLKPLSLGLPLEVS